MSAFRLPCVALAVLCAAALGGCGGGHRDPAEVLSEAFGHGAPPIRTAHLDARLDVAGQPIAGLVSPLSLRVSGPVGGPHAGPLPRFDVRMALRTARGRTELGAISMGDRAWLVLRERAYTLSGADFRRLAHGRSAGADGSPGGGSLAGLGVSPGAWLRDPQDAGEATVDGARVDRVRAGVDVRRMLADLDRVLGRTGTFGAGRATGLPESLPAAQRASIARSVRSAQVEVWAGRDDHLLRRLALTVAYTARGRDGTLRLVIGLSGVNLPQPIGPPAGARPLGELTAALRRLGAQARREDAAGVGGPGATAYEKCLADAGGDLALALRCAALVGR